MAEHDSFFDNLMHRRVPHIVGMYIAATWLVIELGDWVTERFNLPEQVTSFVFVGMLILLPAVILFAYNHGAPGRDEWTKTEKVFIPVNLLAALGVLYIYSPQLNLTNEALAVETRQIEDETGALQTVEVPLQGKHKDVINFFFKNETGDSDLDWLSYALSTVVGHDMDRVSPAISVRTPFHSFVAQNTLTEGGFAAFLDEPRGLQLEIARKRADTAMVVGSFSGDGETKKLTATVVDVESGETLGSHEAIGSDWLTISDQVSAAILEFLDVSPSSTRSNDPISEHFSSSMEAIKHYITAEVEVEIQNNYPGGIAELQKAVELDPQFAEAFAKKSVIHYLAGDVGSARTAAQDALRNGYRLSEASKFRLKANRYLFDGRHDRAQRVVEMWTEVEPTNAQAFRVLASISKVRGGEEGLAMASTAYDRVLELVPTDDTVYREKAAVEQQRGDIPSAIKYLQTYLDKNPGSAEGFVQMAGLYQSEGDLDTAQQYLEDAAIVSDDPLGSELGLARLEARRGLNEAARNRVAQQVRDGLTEQQRLLIVSAQIELSYAAGRIEEAIDYVDQANELAKSLMPPMIRLLSIANPRANFLYLQGDVAGALKEFDDIRGQLQPPLDSYMNFGYTTIYGETGEQEKFKEWAAKTDSVKGNLPDVFAPFLILDSAMIAIWEERNEDAVSLLDQAKSILEQSLISTMDNNLSMSEMNVKLAEMYIKADALDKGKDAINEVLKVYPASGTAKLVLAKHYLAQDNPDAARTALQEALEIWSDGDQNYIRVVEAKDLLSKL